MVIPQSELWSGFWSGVLMMLRAIAIAIAVAHQPFVLAIFILIVILGLLSQLAGRRRRRAR